MKTAEEWDKSFDHDPKYRDAIVDLTQFIKDIQLDAITEGKRIGKLEAQNDRICIHHNDKQRELITKNCPVCVRKQGRIEGLLEAKEVCGNYFAESMIQSRITELEKEQAK